MGSDWHSAFCSHPSFHSFQNRLCQPAIPKWKRKTHFGLWQETSNFQNNQSSSKLHQFLGFWKNRVLHHILIDQRFGFHPRFHSDKFHWYLNRICYDTFNLQQYPLYPFWYFGSPNWLFFKRSLWNNFDYRFPVDQESSPTNSLVQIFPHSGRSGN